jgi:hypothetical protein
MPVIYQSKAYALSSDKTYLRRFDVIVEVVSESLNVGYNLISSLGRKVSRK